ncbi:hypothetical protein IID19_00350 [Patescibacteria group bacterium]|nr:hypothetical protein [Patescibacteria group bacterium]
MALGIICLAQVSRLASQDSPHSTAQGKESFMFLHNWWQSIQRKFPGRIILGKIGMWMVSAGQVLQRKYAGWNKDFRIKCDVFETSGYHTTYISLSDMITEENVITFGNPSAQLNKQTEYVKALFQISGICAVELRPYQVKIDYSPVFTYEELGPKVERILIQHLAA